jgi:hypothetical protein
MCSLLAGLVSVAVNGDLICQGWTASERHRLYVSERHGGVVPDPAAIAPAEQAIQHHSFEEWQGSLSDLDKSP